MKWAAHRHFVLIAIWVVLSTAALVSPALVSAGDPADLVTRQTARVAVLFWAIAAAAILLRNLRFGRVAWTIACAANMVHVAVAFEWVHGWSHAAAFQHVEDVSGFGPGIFVSYAFSVLWITDVIWWWALPSFYASRPVWLDLAIHAFLAFVVFNGTVVYETGFIRWAGLVLFTLLALLLIHQRLSHRQQSRIQTGR
jgi:hypothetical protein